MKRGDLETPINEKIPRRVIRNIDILKMKSKCNLYFKIFSPAINHQHDMIILLCVYPINILSYLEFREWTTHHKPIDNPALETWLDC